MKQTGYSIKKLLIAISITEVVTWSLFFLLKHDLETNTEEFQFEEPWYLWFLFAVPAYAMMYYLYTLWRNKAIGKFASSRMMRNLMHPISDTGNITRFVLTHFALFFLIIGIANPQYGKSKISAKRSGIDVMIALDISNSMLAEDMGSDLNRLRYAKLAIEKMINTMKGDRVGIVVFAGDAFVKAPITDDYAATKLFLASIHPGNIPIQGTAIGRAIDKCAESFDADSPTKKAIIVISDGEEHENKPEQSAEFAKEKGIQVFTIGVGSNTGSPIPLYDENDNRIGVKRDAQGNTVITKLNEQMMQNIARAGGGTYVKANRGDFGLDFMIREINKIEKKEYNAKKYENYDHQFQFFIAMAGLLLIAELFVTNTYFNK